MSKILKYVENFENPQGTKKEEVIRLTIEKLLVGTLTTNKKLFIRTLLPNKNLFVAFYE